jgi:CheY-like chemotaxis protein
MSGYRAPALPVAALVTRHRAGAMAFLSDRFKEYRLVLVPSLAELLSVAAAQPPQLVIVDLVTLDDGPARIVEAIRADPATATVSIVLLSDGPLPGDLVALTARGDFLVAPRARFLPDHGLPGDAASEGDEAV